MVLCHPPSCLHIFRQVSGKFFHLPNFSYFLASFRQVSGKFLGPGKFSAGFRQVFDLPTFVDFLANFRQVSGKFFLTCQIFLIFWQVSGRFPASFVFTLKLLYRRYCAICQVACTFSGKFPASFLDLPKKLVNL